MYDIVNEKTRKTEHGTSKWVYMLASKFWGFCSLNLYLTVVGIEPNFSFLSRTYTHRRNKVERTKEEDAVLFALVYATSSYICMDVRFGRFATQISMWGA